MQTGKGKNPTKTGLPPLNGLEVNKVVKGRGVVMDAVMSPCDPSVAKAYKAWGTYDCMNAAWSADPGDYAAGRPTSTQALRAAAEGFFQHFWMLMQQPM